MVVVCYYSEDWSISDNQYFLSSFHVVIIVVVVVVVVVPLATGSLSLSMLYYSCHIQQYCH